ncbi:MAG TPA: xanthine dehydrogenase family protein subunit M [Verrucomicrobiae bacterium]|jgi:carbon-monoxide dehydrogenase medium subunit|nr:xanthine dehydrogenase family protein subunit M [Verrucomicrobiae bacterium]
MIPAQFDYIAAKSLDDALSLLAKHKDDAKLLAGGHSLIPAMKLRLMQPGVLIDISKIKDLSYIREEGGHVRIGALTTHYQIESSDLLRRICPLLPETATHLGDVQVRNRGTIGGSLAHADPAADWPAAILALDAELVVAGGKGERVIKAEDFFVELLTTALKPGEILREIRFAVPKGKVGQSYAKFRHPASGFAVVGVAVSLTKDGSGKCQSAGVGVTGVSAKPYKAKGVENALKGSALDGKSLSAAAAHAADGVEANADLFASAEYRKHLAEAYTRRALDAAVSRAGK